jgi:hypothetical protein
MRDAMRLRHLVMGTEKPYLLSGWSYMGELHSRLTPDSTRVWRGSLVPDGAEFVPPV